MLYFPAGSWRDSLGCSSSALPRSSSRSGLISEHRRCLPPQICAEDERAADFRAALISHPAGVALPERVVRKTTTTLTKQKGEEAFSSYKISDVYARPVIGLASVCLEAGLNQKRCTSAVAEYIK